MPKRKRKQTTVKERGQEPDYSQLYTGDENVQWGRNRTLGYSSEDLTQKLTDAGVYNYDQNLIYKNDYNDARTVHYPGGKHGQRVGKYAFDISNEAIHGMRGDTSDQYRAYSKYGRHGIKDYSVIKRTKDPNSEYYNNWEEVYSAKYKYPKTNENVERPTETTTKYNKQGQMRKKVTRNTEGRTVEKYAGGGGIGGNFELTFPEMSGYKGFEPIDFSAAQGNTPASGKLPMEHLTKIDTPEIQQQEMQQMPVQQYNSTYVETDPDFLAPFKKQDGGMVNKYEEGGMVEVETEKDELVYVPQYSFKRGGKTEQGEVIGYKKIRDYRGNSKKNKYHSQGGIDDKLPEGAIVASRKYAPFVEDARKRGDYGKMTELFDQQEREKQLKESMTGQLMNGEGNQMALYGSRAMKKNIEQLEATPAYQFDLNKADFGATRQQFGQARKDISGIGLDTGIMRRQVEGATQRQFGMLRDSAQRRGGSGGGRFDMLAGYGAGQQNIADMLPQLDMQRQQVDNQRQQALANQAMQVGQFETQAALSDQEAARYKEAMDVAAEDARTKAIMDTRVARGAAQTQGLFDTVSMAGDVAGTVVGALSDRRLKKNIKKVGETKEGLGIYSYKYKKKVDESQTPQIGLMAQEVEKLYPEAILKDNLGFRAINYTKLSSKLK